jgi:hypothetical protein
MAVLGRQLAADQERRKHDTEDTKHADNQSKNEHAHTLLLAYLAVTAEPSSRRAVEPSSRRAVEPSSRRAVEPLSGWSCRAAGAVEPSSR